MTEKKAQSTVTYVIRSRIFCLILSMIGTILTLIFARSIEEIGTCFILIMSIVLFSAIYEQIKIRKLYTYYCMFRATAEFQERKAKYAITKEKRISKKNLLIPIYLELEDFEKARETDEFIHSHYDEISDVQRYMYEINHVAYNRVVHPEEKEADLEHLKQIYEKVMQKNNVRYKERKILDCIKGVCEKMIKTDERTPQQIIDSIRENQTGTMYEQVGRAYQLALKYQELDDDVNAKVSYEYVVMHGGDTHYVARAKKELEQLKEISTASAQPRLLVFPMKHTDVACGAYLYLMIFTFIMECIKMVMQM